MDLNSEGLVDFHIFECLVSLVRHTMGHLLTFH